MLLRFLKITALNSSSVNLANCSTLISYSVEVSCSFIWLLFLCFTILAITVGFGACQVFPVGIGVLLFVAPSPGFTEQWRIHVKQQCQVLLSWLELLAQEWYCYPVAFGLEARSPGYLKSLGMAVY
uniref:Uncharacterized protein n=1 Tax=Molossus molossus TaxID=27622 RepID=A0A7J8HH48_MOLMO|nr:hypothetical protein HJG59_010992 [Molossus molossus]